LPNSNAAQVCSNDVELLPYGCEVHGGYSRHSHHCPGCITEAREIVRALHERASPDVVQTLERLYALISQGITLGGKLWRPPDAHPS